MSGIINKVKDALHKNDHTHGSTNEGTHNSNTANKLDPRFDSDRDGRANPASNIPGGNTAANAGPGYNSGVGSGVGGVGAGHTGTTGTHTGAHSGGALGSQNHPGSTNQGPHSSNLANKLDPRVDSDADNRANPHSSVPGGNTATNAGYGNSAGYGNQSSGLGGVGAGHSAGNTGGLSHSNNHPGSTNAGPHNSNLLNKVDPRVDSDADHRANPASNVPGGPTATNAGYGAGGVSGTHAGSGLTGSHNAHGTHTGAGGLTGSHGTHGSAVGGAGGYGSSATPGSGNASNTAGPHNSNLLNKLDPRVDSDLDGSKTAGQGAGATYQ